MKINLLVLMLTISTLLISLSFKVIPYNLIQANTTTFSDNVLPLLKLKCSPCHLRSKGGKKTNLENYNTAKKYAAVMLSRVQLNPKQKYFMPSKNDKLKEEEIAVFKKWIEDGLLEK